MRQLFISAAQKSSGKTTLSTGISAVLTARGHSVQTFKKGPDYIDPKWLAMASARPCYNLDFWTQSHAEILQLYASKSAQADFALTEANKGLFDGLSLDGSDSNAALAKLLHSPIILVLDCRGTIRGIAPLILGYQAFDRDVSIKGVILNLVGGSRHESKLRKVVETYTDLPVIGAVKRTPELNLEERYLGLTPSNEDPQARDKINLIATLLEQQIDFDQLIAISSEHEIVVANPARSGHRKPYELIVAYAQDEAFGFYYTDDLETFSELGARLVPFDTLNDKKLPAADALFIGGGFPEKRIAQLSANLSLRQQIKTVIENGMPVYAECGGLMYLSRSIQHGDESGEMVGVIPADTVMNEQPQGRGYIEYLPNPHFSWPHCKDNFLRGHEFHYSRMQNLSSSVQFAFDVKRGQGIDGMHDGLLIHNVLACYAHQRHTENNPWIEQFLSFVQNHKATRC